MVLLITGRPGSGKHAVVEELVRYNGYSNVMVYTTRDPEKDTVLGNRCYMDEKEFAACQEQGELIRYDTCDGEWYGLSKKELEQAGVENKKVCIISPAGAEVIRSAYPETYITCLDADLKDRVIRMTENWEDLDTCGLSEIFVKASADDFIYSVLNPDLTVRNPIGSKLYAVAGMIDRGYNKWAMHNMISECNETLREGLEDLKDAFWPDRDRCMELLEKCVAYITKDNKTPDPIIKLFELGFTEDELEKAFKFKKDDIVEAVAALARITGHDVRKEDLYTMMSGKEQ